MSDAASRADSSVLRFGGACAILLAATTIVAAVIYLALPPEQRVGVSGKDLLPSVAEDDLLLRLEFVALGLTGVLGLGVVPAFSKVVRHRAEGWLRWTSSLAYLGFGVTAVSNFITLERLPRIADAYAAGDASTRAALLPIWRSSLDLQGLWGYGAVGLWILTVSLLTSQDVGPLRPMAYVGAAVGVAHFLIPVALFAGAPGLITVIAVVGTIGVVIWYGWGGLIAFR